jgi:4-deoxy-L-threo-5-hexosulose-uronate ketol-isomerase
MNSTNRPKILYTPRPQEISTLGTEEIRSAFLIENVFSQSAASFAFTDLDRLALCGVQPAGAVSLENDRETGTDYFLARRELGIINTGAAGTVRVDGKAFDLGNLDCLYASMGSRAVSFESADRGKPAKFFLMSAPAHREFPTAIGRYKESKGIALGSQATANQRKIHQYIHANGIKSCQLVMGFTELAEGSVWNTMPPHTHSRRTEIYFYFDLAAGAMVSHFLGEPGNTRHVFVQNEQAVLSPSWSIHAGCGTSAYKFIWAMGGENQTFDDMDKVDPLTLR